MLSVAILLFAAWSIEIIYDLINNGVELSLIIKPILLIPLGMFIYKIVGPSSQNTK